MIATRDLSRCAASQTAVVPPQRSVELAEGLRQARQTLFQDLRLRAITEADMAWDIEPRAWNKQDAAPAQQVLAELLDVLRDVELRE